MRVPIFILAALVAVVEWSPSLAAPERKGNISVGEARREVGVVASFQNFPTDYRLDRLGELVAEDEYYHLFIVHLSKARAWRTLVFANSGDYLGFYQTKNPPVELERDGIIYPGDSYNVESGDEEEGEFDSGDANIIRFGPGGPPDEVKFENKTYTFVSSPKRVRPDDPSYRYLWLANRVADAINRSRYKTVRDYFSEHALGRISEQQTVAILSSVREKLGKVDKVGAPWVQSEGVAVLPVTFDRAVAGLKLMLDADDKIVGMWVLPFTTAFPEVGFNQVPMSLPVEGQWRVLWGGETRATSKYFGDRVSHNAREFVISNRFGKTYRDEGRRNNDFFAFGKPVLAPAAGKVVAVVKGVEDNQPHSPNPFDRLGNAVMIEHATNEFSVIGHLMFESVRVRVGQEVQARQLIGQCGNSGDSSQPSVYFHLQDSPNILSGSGYRPVFEDLYIWESGGTDVAPRHTPVRGEFVQQRSAPKEAPPAGDGGNAEPTGE